MNKLSFVSLACLLTIALPVTAFARTNYTDELGAIEDVWASCYLPSRVLPKLNSFDTKNLSLPNNRLRYLRLLSAIAAQKLDSNQSAEVVKISKNMLVRYALDADVRVTAGFVFAQVNQFALAQKYLLDCPSPTGYNMLWIKGVRHISDKSPGGKPVSLQVLIRSIDSLEKLKAPCDSILGRRIRLANVSCKQSDYNSAIRALDAAFSKGRLLESWVFESATRLSTQFHDEARVTKYKAILESFRQQERLSKIVRNEFEYGSLQKALKLTQKLSSSPYPSSQIARDLYSYYRCANMPQQQEEIVKRLLLCDENSTGYLIRLADVYISRKQFERAEQCFLKAMRNSYLFDGEETKAIISLGIAGCRSSQGDWKGAVAILKEVRFTRPGGDRCLMANVFLREAEALKRLGCLVEAQQCLNRGVKILKNSNCTEIGALYSQRQIINKLLGQKGLAESDYDSLVDFEDNNLPPMMNNYDSHK